MLNRPSAMTIMFAMLAILSACSSDDGNDTDAAGSTEATAASAADTPAETAAEPAAGKPVLKITAVSFATSTITVRNDGAADVALGSMFMCNRPNYAGLPDETLAPGASTNIDVSGLQLDAASGETALYTSQSFDSADDIVAYIQWGGAENGRASVAVAAGLIPAGEFVDNAGGDIAVE